ncbi:glycosyltransferase family 2 protein [Pedobacter helvus]|uniref:Glycosyltransferase family 2 protein n=1 Tax=Pedobacter helvus TaxID=2563444 RepID=A0ABW9JL65_9SPHI|nr:glycosyltransferase [Pedobacter ureilyticus]
MINPLVSIIIPLYNAENYIEETIHSALHQSYKIIEIIIVDDGSTDQSLKIAKKYENGILKVFSQPNKGVSAARNFGLNCAKGTYVQFLDADDIIMPDKIEHQINSITTKSMPAFICSNWAKMKVSSFTDNILIQSRHTPNLNDLPLNLINGDNFIPLMSGLILKDSLKKIGGFDIRMTHIEDVNLLIRLYKQNSHFLYSNSNTPLFYYRNVPRSASNKNYEAFLKGVLKNCQLISQSFNVQSHSSLLENYWYIYLNAVLNNFYDLVELSLIELKPYHFRSSKDLKFKLFKIVGSKAFIFLYRLYRKN